ncbi:MAG: HAMP domain-containing sensor histidine kinase [Thermodesulfobacteriota bacterium]
MTPAFVLIDFARFPDVAPLLLGLRTLYVGANVALLALLATDLGARRPREVALLATACGGLLIFASMAFTGGHASPHVNGMGLIILGMALLMPWSPAWSILTGAMLVASYAAYFAVSEPVGNLRVFVNNVVLFSAAAVIGAVSTSLRERLRWREFKHRFAFESTYGEKCESEAKLRLEVEANRRLIEALEAANRVRAEFLSTMSHELRTPLNVMLGLAEMARDPEFDAAERDDMLERIQRAGVRLLELVEGTLEVGDLEAGRVGIEQRSVAIATLWSELEQGCSDLLPRGEVALYWDDDLPPGEIRTDPCKLLVIVRNLLGNALKFTDRGHVVLRLAGDADRVALVVEDTGIGIRHEDQELVFEMFRQADSSETRRFEGCGLGLYIVRQLAHRLGGSVEVASEPGRGSRFTVTLPRDPSRRGAPAPGSADQAVSSARRHAA